MIDLVEFPATAHPGLSPAQQVSYYKTHYHYVKNILSASGCKVKAINAEHFDDSHKAHFVMRINGRRVLIDYSDHIRTVSNVPPDVVYFKFHTTEELSKSGIIPFPPMSFMSWPAKSISTDLSSRGRIFYKTNDYGAAVARRRKVREILRRNFPDVLETRVTSQEDYFRDMRNCRINVVVPGARDDILDRTHMQSFAMGVPVVSPFLSTILPHGLAFLPDVDYIQCRSDYSDLSQVVKSAWEDIDRLQAISSIAKEKFVAACAPDAVSSWIKKWLT